VSSAKEFYDNADECFGWAKTAKLGSHPQCYRYGRLRSHLAMVTILPDAETVIALLPAWFEEVHPRSGLKFLSPREFLRLSA
jgi:hypothetical protein